MVFSKTQIDKLGERLRDGTLSDNDLRMLDEYRRSFESAYQYVVGIIRTQLKVDPTGRPAKSTSSIIDKLRREKTRHARLSQIQDIAGCRIVVPGLSEQNNVVEVLKRFFPEAEIVDRRIHPSNGYRAVHVIAKVDLLQVEIQIRSDLQQLWAEMCERLADEFDSSIKYGGGPEAVRMNLLEHSELGYLVELMGDSPSKHEIKAIKDRLDLAARQSAILFAKRIS